MTEAGKSELAGLLRRRLEIIADHAWRDRAAAEHFEALKGISLQIQAWADTHRGEIDARLRHFLGNASFDKALSHLETTS